ncbi:MAG TPA: amidohydrolase family protein [Gemmatimonadaceae bacterium]|nr:amidohydrolase family protein [Gemmatimonadaceae bacterium]
MDADGSNVQRLTTNQAADQRPRGSRGGTATSVAAEVLGASTEIGTIEVGKLADLVFLDEDPLEDIAHTQSIWRVIKGGAVIAPREVHEAVRGLRFHEAGSR